MDDSFFSLLTGATRNLDLAEEQLTDAAGTVSGLSENFTEPSARTFNQGGFVGTGATIPPIISVPIPTASLGDRLVPPPSEPQAQADYDFMLNTLKPSPIYPGASFANVMPEGYNVLGNIQENQGMSPYDQSQRSMVTGTTTGQLSQNTPNPGNQTMQGGLSSLSNTIGTFS